MSAALALQEQPRSRRSIALRENFFAHHETRRYALENDLVNVANDVTDKGSVAA
jgi:hypothetical protein